MDKFQPCLDNRWQVYWQGEVNPFFCTINNVECGPYVMQSVLRAALDALWLSFEKVLFWVPSEEFGDALPDEVVYYMRTMVQNADELQAIHGNVVPNPADFACNQAGYGLAGAANSPLASRWLFVFAAFRARFFNVNTGAVRVTAVLKWLRFVRNVDKIVIVLLFMGTFAGCRSKNELSNLTFVNLVGGGNKAWQRSLSCVTSNMWLMKGTSFKCMYLGIARSKYTAVPAAIFRPLAIFLAVVRPLSCFLIDVLHVAALNNQGLQEQALAWVDQQAGQPGGPNQQQCREAFAAAFTPAPLSDASFRKIEALRREKPRFAANFLIRAGVESRDVKAAILLFMVHQDNQAMGLVFCPKMMRHAFKFFLKMVVMPGEIALGSSYNIDAPFGHGAQTGSRYGQMSLGLAMQPDQATESIDLASMFRLSTAAYRFCFGFSVETSTWLVMPQQDQQQPQAPWYDHVLAGYHQPNLFGANPWYRAVQVAQQQHHQQQQQQLANLRGGGFGGFTISTKSASTDVTASTRANGMDIDQLKPCLASLPSLQNVHFMLPRVGEDNPLTSCVVQTLSTCLVELLVTNDPFRLPPRDFFKHLCELIREELTTSDKRHLLLPISFNNHWSLLVLGNAGPLVRNKLSSSEEPFWVHVDSCAYNGPDAFTGPHSKFFSRHVRPGKGLCDLLSCGIFGHVLAKLQEELVYNCMLGLGYTSPWKLARFAPVKQPIGEPSCAAYVVGFSDFFLRRGMWATFGEIAAHVNSDVFKNEVDLKKREIWAAYPRYDDFQAS